MKQKLPGGMTVRTFNTAPAGFNPLQARDAELLAYGYPARPAAEHMRSRWEQVMSRPIRFITPTFSSTGYRRLRRKPLALDTRPHVPPKPAEPKEQIPIWSGAVVRAGAADRFTWIEGTWTVPNVYPPHDAVDGEWVSASTWVGIDGLDNSNDVLQAGVDSNTMYAFPNAPSSIARQTVVWWEWFPGVTHVITNLPVAQGDTVNCVICTDPGSASDATVYFYNLTSGIAASFLATAPSGFELVGNCAEWIVERIQFTSDYLPTLARFGEVYFDECHAFTKNGLLRNAGSGHAIDMVEGTDVIASGTIETDTLVQVLYRGP